MEAVYGLISSLRDASYPAAQRELEQLKAFAKERGHGSGDLAPWDVRFWRVCIIETTSRFSSYACSTHFIQLVRRKTFKSPQFSISSEGDFYCIVCWSFVGTLFLLHT